MIPAEIFSGEVIEFDPPDYLCEISHELSDEAVELSYETPRLEIEIEEVDPPKGILDMQEWMWSAIVIPLRSAAVFLFRSDLSAVQERLYEGVQVSERSFLVNGVLGSANKLEKV